MLQMNPIPIDVLTVNAGLLCGVCKGYGRFYSLMIFLVQPKAPYILVLPLKGNNSIYIKNRTESLIVGNQLNLLLFPKKQNCILGNGSRDLICYSYFFCRLS
jgi:hypothetical protein